MPMSTARTHPVWHDITAETAAWWEATPEQDLDIVVVGAGIAGLSTALELARGGRRVSVLDREGVGAGETLRTSAHLASALDERFTALARYHGEEGAKQAAASHTAAIEWIARVARAAENACDFQHVPGFLFSCRKRAEDLDAERAAAHDAGLQVAMQPEGLAALPALGPVLRFERQARIDMGAYTLALATQARDAGVRFHRAEVTGIRGGHSPEIACRDGRRLTARAVVAATNVPIHDTGATYMKQAAYRSYVVVGRAPKDSIPDALYWDDGDPYHYIRLRKPDEHEDAEVEVIIGGGDHKTGQDDDPTVYARLQAWARAHFPSLTRFTHAWSGQILEPSDGLAFIGADPDNENVYLVTGDSGNGLTHGTIAAILLGELIAGRDHPWAALYAPGRLNLKSTPTLLRENTNAVAQFRDWLAPSHKAELAQLARGAGVVIRQGVHRVAVYRSGEGALCAHNARCTHLGCVVRWSSEEKSWDCPCHGSRFDARTGAILNGPASEPLAPFPLADDEDMAGAGAP